MEMFAYAVIIFAFGVIAFSFGYTIFSDKPRKAWTSILCFWAKFAFSHLFVCK